MTRCRVIAPLFLRDEGSTYMPGSTVELAQPSAEALAADGVVEIQGAKPDGGDVAGEPHADADLSALYASMTRDQLLQAAEVHGIDVPKRATKAQIAKLLGGR